MTRRQRRMAVAWMTPVMTLVMALGLLAPAQADEALKAALAGAQRNPAHVARDGWRHPEQTLVFFGLRPDMTVVELSPGGGWYTEILAPYLRDKGQLILAADDPESVQADRRRSAERLKKSLTPSRRCMAGFGWRCLSHPPGWGTPCQAALTWC